MKRSRESILIISGCKLTLSNRNFHDKESEVRYWKGRYYDLQDTLRETEATLHDFMDSSKELEKEMDREISAAQSKINELQVKSEKLKGDVDEWKVCAYKRTF